MDRPKKEHIVIFHDSRLKYLGRVVRVNGVLMERIPAYYKRVYKMKLAVIPPSIQ